MKLLATLFLCGTVAAQLPQPVFPPIAPITTSTFYGGNCNSAQPSEIPAPGSLDAQRHRMYTNNLPAIVGQPITTGSWVAHETWCSLFGDYLVVLFIDIGPGACWNVWNGQGTLMGAPFAPGSNRLNLFDAPISLYPTHAFYPPFDGSLFYCGYQIPSSLSGYGVVTQWARLDPINGQVYLSSTRGYNVQ